MTPDLAIAAAVAAVTGTWMVAVHLQVRYRWSWPIDVWCTAAGLLAVITYRSRAGWVEPTLLYTLLLILIYVFHRFTHPAD